MEALQQLLAFHFRAFQEGAAKLPYLTRTEKFLTNKDVQAHAQAIRLTIERMEGLTKVTLSKAPDVPKAVIRAPAVEPDAEAWLAKIDKQEKQAKEEPSTGTTPASPTEPSSKSRRES